MLLENKRACSTFHRTNVSITTPKFPISRLIAAWLSSCPFYYSSEVEFTSVVVRSAGILMDRLRLPPLPPPPPLLLLLWYNDWMGSGSIDLPIHLWPKLAQFNLLCGAYYCALTEESVTVLRHYRAYSDESVRWCADRFKFLNFQEPRGCRTFRRISCGIIESSREANTYAVYAIHPARHLLATVARNQTATCAASDSGDTVPAAPALYTVEPT